MGGPAPRLLFLVGKTVSWRNWKAQLHMIQYVPFSRSWELDGYLNIENDVLTVFSGSVDMIA